MSATDEFCGTTVRIPFRTPAQAQNSEISKIVVTPAEILQIFEDYQRDVVESLVFLKNIERVEFHLNDTTLGHISVRNIDSVKSLRTSIARAIASGSAASHGMCFDIEREYGGNHTLESYLLRQSVFDMYQYGISPEFKTWIAESKSVSVIALSARLNETDSPSVGRLFVTLPLPIPLDQTRVNINGMFALRRDRRSLWTDNDADSARTMSEILWNNFMFRNFAPIVWHSLLENLTQFKRTVYEYFPLMPPTVGSLFNNLGADVLKQIIDAKSCVWRSTMGQYMPLEMGFVTVKKLNQPLLDCLTNLRMPVFADIPDTIIGLLQKTPFPHRIVTPGEVRIWLRQNLKTCEPDMAMRLLEYISEDEEMHQLFDLPLFLTKEGKLKSLSVTHDNTFESKLYIGTPQESALFDPKGKLFLRIEDYPPDVVSRIRTRAPLMSASLNLEMFTLQSFERFTRSLFAHPSLANRKPNIIPMSLCKIDLAWLQALWRWLDSNPDAKPVEKAVQSLWLIPLEGGKSIHQVRD